MVIAHVPTYLTAQEREAIMAFVSRLQEKFPGCILQTILFGSKARGDSHAELDIDLLILVQEEDWPLRQAINTLAARISLDYDVLLGPRVIGQSRWEQMAAHNLSLHHNIAAEGIRLSPANLR